MAIDKKVQEAIDNYGDTIETLKDFQTGVRTRPGMYIGPVGSEGLVNMCREIFQNSVDQVIMQESPADHFIFRYDERTHLVEVEDNGLGMPFDDIIRILTTPHTSKNFEKKPYDFSSGLNGIGAKVVNSLSDPFIVESYRYDGKAVKMEFHKGYPTTKKPVPIPNKSKKQGTKITFIPDETILGEMNVPWKRLYDLIKLIMCQTNIGDYMQFEAVDKNGKLFKEKIVNVDGVMTPLIMKIQRPIIKPIVVFGNDGYHKLNCAFCFDSGDETGPDPEESVIAFSNFCPTTKGTHIDGVVEGIARWFSKYMNTVYLANQKAKKNKLTVTFADIKNGLNVMISAAHIDPEFTGQAKEILSNADMVPFCKEVVLNGLDEWSKTNPQDLAKISKFFKEMAEIRQKTDKEKVKIANKFGSNPINGLPAKYKRPLGKKNIELIVVEGDSALGTVVDGRDPMTQGAFPIRGKIKNAFNCTRQKFFENEEVQGITRIILGPKGYDRHFKAPEDCLVDKVIFMADEYKRPKMLFV